MLTPQRRRNEHPALRRLRGAASGTGGCPSRSSDDSLLMGVRWVLDGSVLAGEWASSWTEPKFGGNSAGRRQPCVR